MNGVRARWMVWLVGALLACGAAAVAALSLSQVSLSGGGEALASLDVGALGGSFAGGYVVTPSGKRVALVRTGSRLTPAVQLADGERVRVFVTVKRSGALAWALGARDHESLTVTTPAAAVSSRWIQAQADGTVRVGFTGSVQRVSYVLDRQPSIRRFTAPATGVTLGRPGPAGTVTIAASPRSWLRLGKRASVAWFPHSRTPVAVVSPRPGTVRGPADPVRLTFSVPVSQVLGSRRPRLSPSAAGRWAEPDSHTLVFTPSGYGTGFGATLRLSLPRAVKVSGPDGAKVVRTAQIRWKGQPGSTLRLQQLLAEAGYLPVSWRPTGTPVPRTRAAQARAASSAPAGTFGWRYPHTPRELKRQWTPGTIDTITRGAIMMFQDEHGLAVDGVAGAGVWRALLEDTVNGKHRTDGYSYVYVHRDVPQRLVLWHDGRTVLTSPGNTGVPAAPTQLGTFPVFEHLATTTMSGTNPDGSHYNDPGIKWVSYFNGGDALHAFPRASFGTPQSLGCVELPLDAAAKIWPYTPIGTLVTIEN